MTLEEFMISEAKRLKAFEDMWRKNHQETPEDWPMAMSVADWEEQLLFMYGDEE